MLAGALRDWELGIRHNHQARLKLIEQSVAHRLGLHWQSGDHDICSQVRQPLHQRILSWTPQIRQQQNSSAPEDAKKNDCIIIRLREMVARVWMQNAPSA